MKVILISEGGKNIGFGHITRCLALYQAFEERGTELEFIVNGDNSILDLLKDKYCQIFNWIKEKNKMTKLVSSSDMAIIDSYLADKSLYNSISKITNGRLVMIDDYNRLEYPKGIIVNPSIYGDKIVYPQKKGLTYLSGKDYVILRKEFWNVPGKKINKNIKKVMITFGGADEKDMTGKVLQFLKDNDFEFTKKVIVGKGFKSAEYIQKFKDPITDLIYYPNTKEMKGLMLESDLAISSAGQTLNEFARVGLPTIAIALADNQLNNAKGWQEAGFVRYAGWWQDAKSLEKIGQFINQLADPNQRANIYRAGKKFIDGKGCTRIVDYVFNRYYKENRQN
ncbi:MAG: UDP-2,4-diacetamido-2,4,6-trideoxy-beta-L-altropyranose hydrolase [Candidatus Omnitrophota bacterium]|jgi:UDP-2,4-diacetamido-2,4,6-trideoxy-beta-L-altropyranose hydrolase